MKKYEVWIPQIDSWVINFLSHTCSLLYRLSVCVCFYLIIDELTMQLDAPLSTMMRSPPPSVMTSTSIGHVVDLILEKRYPMVIIVNCKNSYATTPYSSRAVGVFTSEQLSRLITPVSQLKGICPSLHKR